MFQQLQGQIHVEEGDSKIDYHLQNHGLIYKIYKLYVSKGKILHLIIEPHPSKVARNFVVGKTIANLQRHVYYPKMKDVGLYIKGCILCYINNGSNRKQDLYHPLHVPTRPWESISMNFVCGLPTIRKGHEIICGT